jgi:hypothetical protein
MDVLCVCVCVCVCLSRPLKKRNLTWRNVFMLTQQKICGLYIFILAAVFRCGIRFIDLPHGSSPPNSLWGHLSDHTVHLTLWIPTGHLITGSELCDTRLYPRETGDLVQYSDCTMRWAVGDGVSIFSKGKGLFPFFHSVTLLPWAHLSSYTIDNTELFSPRVKRPQLGTDLSPPSSGEFKSAGLIPQVPPSTSS